MSTHFKRILYGGDYNPNQWTKDIWQEDMRIFKDAHINTATINVFSWAKIQPSEHEYNFDELDEIVDMLSKENYDIVFATSTAALPGWMVRKYPEVMFTDYEGRQHKFGGRHNACPNSFVFKHYARELAYKLAERYADNPHVTCWHVSNEYGNECFCENCQKAFRVWLKDKYKTIDALNKAWNMEFWGHTVYDWDDVVPPNALSDGIGSEKTAFAGISIDYRRFYSDSQLACFKMERDAIKSVKPDAFVTTNLMGTFKGLDYFKWAKEMDVVSWDNYPQWHKKEEYLTAMDNGMQHDIMRSIQKKPFLLMENCPSATNWQSVSKLKKPGMLHAASMQAVAHGSDSILYFQLRQSQGSSEKFHGAVIDHYGKDDTRVFKEVTEVGESLEKLQEVTGAKNPAQVAVVYDWENRWAMEDAQGPRNKGLFYKETVEKSYYAFRKQGLNVDMIDMEQDLDGYKVVAAPMLYMFREGFEEKVRKYVENGGTFILTYWSGIVDSTDLCFLGGTPHGLMDVMGLRSTEIDGLYDGEYNRGVPVRGNELCLTKTYTCNHLCELVKTSTAQPLMTYETDFYAGMPALTVNLFGKGKAYHVYDEVYRKIAKEAGVKRVVAHIPEGVEVSVRRNQDTDYVFVQNFNRQPVEVKLPVEQYPVWLGKYDGTIDRFGTVVLKGKAGEKE